MFGLLRKFGWIAGLAAAARSPVGQRAIARAKNFINDPATRNKLAQVRSKVMSSRSGGVSRPS